jgi:serine/threonine protein kinase
MAYEENDDHSKAYLWTEYCNGGDLSKFIRKDLGNDTIIEPQRRLTKREVWRIFADVAAAVSYLHLGVIKENDSFSLKTDWNSFLHRDIKPANGNQIIPSKKIFQSPH